MGLGSRIHPMVLVKPGETDSELPLERLMVFSPSGTPMDLLGSVSPSHVPNTAVIFGASGDGNNGSDPSVNNPIMSRSPRGYMTYLDFLLRGRIEVVKQAGVGGRTSTQILSHLESDVLNVDAGYAFIVSGPGNDPPALSLSSSINNMAQIFESIIASGKRVVTTPLWPFSDTIDANTPPFDAAAARIWRAGLVEFYQDFAENNDDFILIDGPAALMDPLTGKLRVTSPPLTYDGRHLNQHGSLALAKAMASVLSPIMPFNDRLSSDAFDPSNLLGSKGFMAGTIGTDHVPTGWAKGGGSGARINISEREDGLGNWAEIEILVDDTVASLFVAIPAAARANGARPYLECECHVVNDGGGLINLGIQSAPQTGGPTAYTQAMVTDGLLDDVDGDGSIDDALPNVPNPGFGVIRTYRHTLTSNYSGGFLGLKVAGKAGTKVRFGRVGLYA